ncbi:MAG: TerB family tellurite resistance protein [Deltaproteobacteria bacterium]|nr:TerB family tellurite resistance protein [Deltaproteobacteria bacterium]
MIKAVKNFFGGVNRDEAVRKGAVHDIRIAACALLIEMSRIDGEFGEGEREGILAILRDDYGLSDGDAGEIMKAADEELAGSRDLWEFTNFINQNFQREEKMQIIEMIWRIAYTDGRLDAHEDYLAHKMANLLRLNHQELIDAKLRVRAEMGISGETR